MATIRWCNMLSIITAERQLFMSFWSSDVRGQQGSWFPLIQVMVWCSDDTCTTGWPRSGWPQVGHFDQKIKVNQIASYCAMLYPRCCSLWSCTFWGLHSSAFDSSAGQTRGYHFNFYWGTDTTMWSYVHFLCSCVTKIDFYHLLWNWRVKRLIKQQK